MAGLFTTVLSGRVEQIIRLSINETDENWLEYIIFFDGDSQISVLKETGEGYVMINQPLIWKLVDDNVFVNETELTEQMAEDGWAYVAQSIIPFL